MKKSTVRRCDTEGAARPFDEAAWESGHPLASKARSHRFESDRRLQSSLQTIGGHPWGKPILAAIASIGPTVPR